MHHHFGLGAVLSHVYPSGEKRQKAFASRTLYIAEKNYSQIDKKAFGIVWGIKNFQMYMYGRHFSLITDHKPLVSIFHSHKGIPFTTAARLQRYAVFLSGLGYSIEYRNTKHRKNADGLSRLPSIPTTSREEEAEMLDSAHVFHMSQLETLPVSASEVIRKTAWDPVISRVHVYEATICGWHDVMDLVSHEDRRLLCVRVVYPGDLVLLSQNHFVEE